MKCSLNLSAHEQVMNSVGGPSCFIIHLFTAENGSTQKHNLESINTNKAKTAKTATKFITVVDTCNYIVIILHQT